MSAISFTAPGKLFVLGEYAVLSGASALLRAVDRRVRVRVTETGHPASSTSGWSLSAPELGITHLALGANGALPDSLDRSLSSQLRLFAEVRAAVDRLTPANEALEISIESSQFRQDGHKLGLGSSAAVAVALTAALTASRGIDLTTSALFDLASGAHSAAQGGKGSGGDIAASVYGGHILYRVGSEPLAVRWPNDLELLAVVTGTGSSTVELVSKIAEYAEQNPAAHQREIDQLTLLAQSTQDALKSADNFLALADEYFRGIERLDTLAQAGIVTQKHRELRKIAADFGAVFKTSGAGGGDLGLVITKREQTEHLLSALLAAGVAVIPVPYSADGVRREAA